MEQAVRRQNERTTRFTLFSFFMTVLRISAAPQQALHVRNSQFGAYTYPCYRLAQLSLVCGQIDELGEIPAG